MPSHRQLTHSWSLQMWMGWGLVAGLYGALAAWSLSGLEPGRWADRTLVLTGLGALPVPIILLGWLTTPKFAATRRFLGQSPAGIFEQSVRVSWRLIAAQLSAPVGVIVAGTVLGLPTDQLLLAAALVTMGTVGAALMGIGLIAGALVTIGKGTPGLWKKMAGVAYGPPETAPLLYAPAMAFLVGLIPVALLAAMWNAAPQLLPADRAWIAVGFVAVMMFLWARRQCAQASSCAHNALITVAQAHATPFALDEEAPQPPDWLVDGSASGRFLGRAWVRRYPATVLSSALIAGAITLSLSRKSPDWVVLCLCIAATLYGGLRGLGLLAAGPELVDAGRWLGAPRLEKAEASLSRRLALPSVLVVAAGWVSGAWLAALAGCFGGMLGAALVGKYAGRNVGLWLGRTALVAALMLSTAAG